MIAILAAAILLLPSTKTDMALRCTDPDHAAAYRVPAEWLDGRWVFVTRADATCVDAADHFSHWSKYWGNRHHDR